MYRPVGPSTGFTALASSCMALAIVHFACRWRAQSPTSSAGAESAPTPSDPVRTAKSADLDPLRPHRRRSIRSAISRRTSRSACSASRRPLYIAAAIYAAGRQIASAAAGAAALCDRRTCLCRRRADARARASAPVRGASTKAKRGCDDRTRRRKRGRGRQCARGRKLDARPAPAHSFERRQGRALLRKAVLRPIRRGAVRRQSTDGVEARRSAPENAAAARLGRRSPPCQRQRESLLGRSPTGGVGPGRGRLRKAGCQAMPRRALTDALPRRAAARLEIRYVSPKAATKRLPLGA